MIKLAFYFTFLFNFFHFDAFSFNGSIYDLKHDPVGHFMTSGSLESFIDLTNSQGQKNGLRDDQLNSVRIQLRYNLSKVPGFIPQTYLDPIDKWLNNQELDENGQTNFDRLIKGSQEGFLRFLDSVVELVECHHLVNKIYFPDENPRRFENNVLNLEMEFTTEKKNKCNQKLNILVDNQFDFWTNREIKESTKTLTHFDVRMNNPLLPLPSSRSELFKVGNINKILGFPVEILGIELSQPCIYFDSIKAGSLIFLSHDKFHGRLRMKNILLSLGIERFLNIEREDIILEDYEKNLVNHAFNTVYIPTQLLYNAWRAEKNSSNITDHRVLMAIDLLFFTMTHELNTPFDFLSMEHFLKEKYFQLEVSRDMFKKILQGKFDHEFDVLKCLSFENFEYFINTSRILLLEFILSNTEGNVYSIKRMTVSEKMQELLNAIESNDFNIIRKLTNDQELVKSSIFKQYFYTFINYDIIVKKEKYKLKNDYYSFDSINYPRKKMKGFN